MLGYQFSDIPRGNAPGVPATFQPRDSDVPAENPPPDTSDSWSPEEEQDAQYARDKEKYYANLDGKRQARKRSKEQAEASKWAESERKWQEGGRKIRPARHKPRGIARNTGIRKTAADIRATVKKKP
jgi:hypothetical protein